jgi:hypothetical protein
MLEVLAGTTFDEASEAAAARAMAARESAWNPLGKATPYEDFQAARAASGGADNGAGSKRKAGSSAAPKAAEDLDIFTARRRRLQT